MESVKVKTMIKLKIFKVIIINLNSYHKKKLNIKKKYHFCINYIEALFDFFKNHSSSIIEFSNSTKRALILTKSFYISSISSIN
jgi:hypothetical protein